MASSKTLVFVDLFHLPILLIQEEPISKGKHCGDLKEEEEQEMEKEELEASIQSIDSLSRYCYFFILISL